MLEIIKIIEVVIAVLLSVIVLIQQKKSSLNLTTFGSDNNSKFERRGPEKVIHNMTIGLGAIFVVLALVYFFMA